MHNLPRPKVVLFFFVVVVVVIVNENCILPNGRWVDSNLRPWAGESAIERRTLGTDVNLALIPPQPVQCLARRLRFGLDKDLVQHELHHPTLDFSESAQCVQVVVLQTHSIA